MILLNTLITILERLNLQSQIEEELSIQIFEDMSGAIGYLSFNDISTIYTLNNRQLAWVGEEDLEELIEYINNTLDELENDN